MPNRWQHIETWVGLAIACAGALAAVNVGLFTYVTFTASPLHPEPNGVPSVSGADPSTHTHSRTSRMDTR